MHPLLNIAIKAARNAGKIVLRATERLATIKITEKAPNDFVSETDLQVEEELIRNITAAYPEHAIWGEETGRHGTSDYLWLLDPIDGTNNFIHGHPHFAISIAVQIKNVIEHGVIYDPLRQELFTASRGSGAFLNERRIRVTKRQQFSGALLAAGLAHRNYSKDLDNYLRILAQLLPKAAGTRRSGSTALDFAYVAAGRLDGLWGMNLATWDLAAGALLVQEAGGLVGGFTESEDYCQSGNAIAANYHLFNQLRSVIQTTYRHENHHL